MIRIIVAVAVGFALGGCIAQALPGGAQQAIVTIVVNFIGYAAVRRDVVSLRKQNQKVVEDHEHRLTVLERRSV